MTENQITGEIIDAAISLHRHTGPGLLESAYKHALAYDLREKGLNVQLQVPMPFIYKGIKQDVAYRVDMLVEKKVLTEIKSVESLSPVHFAQTLTYLKLSNLKVALLINFNTKLLKNQIHRIVHNF
jgi:GxxExxY protein